MKFVAVPKLPCDWGPNSKKDPHRISFQCPSESCDKGKSDKTPLIQQMNSKQTRLVNMDSVYMWPN